MQIRMLMFGLFFVGLVSLGPAGKGQSAVTFGFPIGCTINVDCFFANYVDQGPGKRALRDYNCGPITYDGHLGIDITLLNFRIMDQGVPVLAAADGVVTKVRDGEFDRNNRFCPGCPANRIWIEHADGTQSRYLHLKKGSLKVNQGDRVSRDQEIALVGSSGNSTDAHLHFEVASATGAIIDPFKGPCGSSTSWWDEQLPYENEFQVLDFGMTNVEPTEAKLKERPDTITEFTLADQVFAFWIQLKSVNEGDVSRLQWVAPDGKVFKNLALTHDFYVRYDWKYWSQRITSSLSQGEWVAQYFLNGEMKASMAFRLSQ